MPVLDAAVYLEAYRLETSRIAAVARRGLDAPVPSCPGWTVATLVTHLAGIYTHRVALVRSRPAPPVAGSYAAPDLPEPFKLWMAYVFDDDAIRLHRPAPPVPAGIVELFERTAADLARTLWALDPSDPIWTWFPADQSAGFWQRRMAQETAVHRWDAELAHGTPGPIASELASDGVDEIVDVMLPMRPRWAETARRGAGERYHFHRTDGPGEWLVTFAPDGPVVTREHARGDVALRGSASDLLLWLWHRIRADRLEVFGDTALVDRFFELVPPD